MADRNRVELTESASADLETIFKYVEQRSPDNAAKLIDRILVAVRGLDILSTRHPVAGRRRSSKAIVYKFVVESFLVYYAVDPRRDRVTVLHVRHGARRQPRRFE
jgi:plasmid stabilization system protein ParE